VPQSCTLDYHQFMISLCTAQDQFMNPIFQSAAAPLGPTAIQGTFRAIWILGPPGQGDGCMVTCERQGMACRVWSLQCCIQDNSFCLLIGRKLWGLVRITLGMAILGMIIRNFTVSTNIALKNRTGGSPPEHFYRAISSQRCACS